MAVGESMRIRSASALGRKAHSPRIVPEQTLDFAPPSKRFAAGGFPRLMPGIPLGAHRLGAMVGAST